LVNSTAYILASQITALGNVDGPSVARAHQQIVASTLQGLTLASTDQSTRADQMASVVANVNAAFAQISTAAKVTNLPDASTIAKQLAGAAIAAGSQDSGFSDKLKASLAANQKFTSQQPSGFTMDAFWNDATT
jgi:hypothetical protein